MEEKISPKTLARTGFFEGKLEEVVNKFSDKVRKINFGLGNTIKYGLFEESDEHYFLMVSQQKDRMPSDLGYNVILSVSSYSHSRNSQVADEFEAKTGIKLDGKIPKFLLDNSDIMNISFLICEKNGQDAMKFLESCY